MSLLQETLRRCILQTLNDSLDEYPVVDVNFIFEANTEQLQQIFDDIKTCRSENARQRQIVEKSELISFAEAIKISKQSAILSKWAEARFKEFFVRQREENKYIKDIYARTITGNLFIWDSTSEKWKKVR